MRLDGAWALEVHDSLASTNDRCRDWALEGAGPFSVVVAREQTRGRGRNGKRWVSRKDSGLWMSVLLPAPVQGPAGSTSILCGVCLAWALEEVGGVRVGLKWPNDLFLVGHARAADPRPAEERGLDQGALYQGNLETVAPPPGTVLGKVAGILCEVVMVDGEPGIVAGFGVNLLRPSGADINVAEGAAFLEDGAGGSTVPDHLAQALVGQLRRWADPPAHGLHPAVQEGWRDRDLLAGRPIVLDGGRQGWARGVGADGALLVDDGTGKIAPVHGGSVRIRGSEVLGMRETA